MVSENTNTYHKISTGAAGVSRVLTKSQSLSFCSAYVNDGDKQDTESIMEWSPISILDIK